MKTKVFIFVAIACAMASLVASVGCVNKSNAQSGNSVGDELTLNLSDTLYARYVTGAKLPVQWTDTLPGGYWNETYNDTIQAIQIGKFLVSHLPAGVGASFGGSYWDGFTIGTNGDNNNYGLPNDSAGSVDWITHQWGVMAGGGLTNPPAIEKGAPYLIAYWGYHMEPEWWFMHFGNIPPAPMHCLTVALEDSALFAPQEVYICNHPWPYYGNMYGDGFAKSFEQLGDKAYFDLWIHAVHANGSEDSLSWRLADYDSGEPHFVYESPDWEQVFLTDLGDDIKYLYFTMDTYDTDAQYGPNTAVYFCMDKLKVIEQGPAPANALVPKAQTHSIAQTAKAVEITNNFPLPSVSGGDVIVYDNQGKVVLQTTVKAGEKINLSKLPKGEYRLRHGHKHIPITKK